MYTFRKTSTRKTTVATGVLVILALLSFALNVTAENGSLWRAFKTADGLDDALCTTVTVSQRTNVWISHFQNGFATSFDGYQMTKIPAPGVGPFRVYESPGGQVWSVSRDGVQEYRDRSWIDYGIEDVRTIASTNALGLLRLVTLFPLRQGHLLICLPTRLLEFSEDRAEKTTVLRVAAATKLGKFSEMAAARDGGVWVAGRKGIARIRGSLRNVSAETPFEEYVAPEDLGLSNFQRPFEDADGGVTLVAEAAEEKRVVVYFDGHDWTVLRPREKVRLAWRDADQTFWAMTANSLLRCDRGQTQFVEDQEVSVSQFFDAALTMDGAFWVATSDGLFRHGPLPWRTPPSLKSINGRVHALAEDREHRVWMASNIGLHCWDGNKLQSFPYPDGVDTFFQPSDGLWLLSDNKFVMNVDGRLLAFDVSSHAFRVIAHPTGGRVKALGWIKPGALCVQVTDAQSYRSQLQTFDGNSFSPLMELPENWTISGDLMAFFVAQNGALWVGNNTGVAVHQNNVWKQIKAGDGPVPDGAFAFAETSENAIWCGSNERLWSFNGKAWTPLRSGFDHVNAITRTGAIFWFASNNGLSAMQKGNWLENSIEDGLPHSAVLTVFEDSRRRVWAGTAHGVSVYEPAADEDPPQTSVERLDNKQNNLPEETATLVFHAQDRWKVTQTERILFSFRLDEQDWSTWSPTRSITFPGLASGKHYFQVRTIDRNWNVDPNPAVLEFAITLPWYMETRLVLIAIAGCGVACFFAVLAYNRHRKLVRSYAEIEKIVALRTEQLEKANKELLHSQKMTALGTLSAGIAHDFNNILSIIKGSAQIIETNLDDREKIQTRLSRIKTVVEQGAGIVKAMLGFSRSGEKQLTACNINVIVEDTIKLLGDRFLREVEIRFERQPDLPAIAASSEFVQQIILNFIFNAADATNGPGIICLRTGRVSQLSDYVALQPATSAEYLFVAVEDFGCGISADLMPRIFEPFFTTKAFSARRGTGLGLSMVYELAKEMGSGLVVKSQAGKGSTFMLVLPLLPQRETAK